MGDILLISSCLLYSINENYYALWLAITAILFQSYFKGGKYGGFLLNCSKIPHIVLCWNSQLWVDFKIESVLGYSRKIQREGLRTIFEKDPWNF